MSGYPLVSVVMSCYNCQATIREAVDSILSQSLRDFEFIIIDDCSTDDTIRILKTYKDDRIVLIVNEANKGLGSNLNYGVKISKGRFIARMDSDDISLPSRFEKQVDYLKSHPDTICVGTRAIRFGRLPIKALLFNRVMKQPLSYEEIKVQMLNGTPLLHPSVMFNGSILRESGLNYNPDFRRAQDYELWSRMVWDYKVENMKDCLLKYRYSSLQASAIHRNEQVSRSAVMYKRVLEKLFNREVTSDDIYVHTLFSTRSVLSNEDFVLVSNWLDILHEAVKKSSFFSEDAFNRYMAYRWAVICSNSFLNREARFRAYNEKKYLGVPNLIAFLRLVI